MANKTFNQPAQREVITQQVKPPILPDATVPCYEVLEGGLLFRFWFTNGTEQEHRAWIAKRSGRLLELKGRRELDTPALYVKVTLLNPRLAVGAERYFMHRHDAKKADMQIAKAKKAAAKDKVGTAAKMLAGMSTEDISRVLGVSVEDAKKLKGTSK